MEIKAKSFKERVYEFGHELNGDESYNEQELYKLILDMYAYINTQKLVLNERYTEGYEHALINLETEDREFCIKALKMDIALVRKRQMIRKDFISYFEDKEGEEDE